MDRGRRWRVTLAGFAAGGLVACGFLTASFIAARRDIAAGLKHVEAARAGAGWEALDDNGGVVPELRLAEQRFASAEGRLGAPPWAVVKLLPIVGRQARSLEALAGAARTASAIGVRSVTRLRQVSGTQPEDERNRPAVIRQLADLAAQTETQLGAIDLGPRTGLLPALARRRNEVADKLRGLRIAFAEASLVGRAAADFLDGPRRYLVFAANNAEMRAGAGMFLSVGELVTGHGRLQLGEMTPVTEIPVPAGSVTVAGDLADRWGWLRPNEEWRNLMLSPRFDVSAELAAQMWHASGHEPVDGVIALDVEAVRDLLKATGPVTVAERTISADDVVEELTHGQYLKFPSGDEKAQRKEQLGAIARAIFEAISAPNLAVDDLPRSLASAARGRHLLLWSARADEQAAWATAGAAGLLSGDSLLLALVNRGGNKLDSFLHVAADLALQPDGTDTLGTLRVRLDNRAPLTDPRLVIGPEPGSGAGPAEYIGLLTVTLPGSARDSRIEGVDRLAVAGGDGPTRVVGVQLTVASGEAKTVVITFHLPPADRQLVVEPSARIPAVNWTSGPQHWVDDSPRRVIWLSTYNASESR